MRFIKQIEQIEGHLASHLVYARELKLPAGNKAKIEALESDRRLLDDTFNEASKAIDNEIRRLGKLL